MKSLGIFLIVIGAMMYLTGVCWAGIASLLSDSPPDLPMAITASITTFGGVLATHLGAVFGIARINGNRFLTLRGPLGPSDRPARYSGLQRSAAWFYVICLLLAVAFWAADGFSANSAEALRNMGLTFIGTIGGVAAVSLNVE